MVQRFSCKSAGQKRCNFAIESDDEDELVQVTQQHAKKVHDNRLSRKDVMDIAKKIQPARS